MRIAILTSVFRPEFGVARVIASQLSYLVKAGAAVDLYACELSREMIPDGVSAVRVPTHLKGLRTALLHGRYDVVIAHTDPFFKFLADTDLGCAKIGYEHGFPPVELCLPEEREWRMKELTGRLEDIYPKLSQVVTISEYARSYIRWPAAKVIYNGADHYSGLTRQDDAVADADSPVTLLAVTRFRKEEWLYKGLDDLCRLKDDLKDRVRIRIAGAGDDLSREMLLSKGIEVIGVVSSREEMARLYGECDALVSFSQWETFNLPLAEAGFARRPAFTLNLCVHPEVTPFVFDTYEALRDYLLKSTRLSLRSDGEKMHAYVSERFRWEQNVRSLLDVIGSVVPESSAKKPTFVKSLVWRFWEARESMRQNVYKKWVKRP